MKFNLLKGDHRKKQSMEKNIQEYFKFINGYTPVFRSFEGGIYEMELTRACIHSFATHISKLRPEVTGKNNNQLIKILQNKPNSLMTTSQFLARIATMYMAENTAFIVPLYDDRFDIIGFYPCSTNKCEVVKEGGIAYLKYRFNNFDDTSCVELDKVGRVIQHQYDDEIFGESNNVLKPTLDLITAQNQAIVESAKTNATIRFIGKLAQVIDDDDLKAEQKRLKENSLGTDNNGGVLLFDQKYEDIKQIDSKPYVVSKAQQDIIKDNVFSYFHTNESILSNNFTESQFNAYYEGSLEPFAIQLGQVLSNMVFTNKEFSFGNEIMFSSNRLQYGTLKDKAEYCTQMFDRGLLTQNQVNDIFQLPHTENGDIYYIRKEYTKVNNLDSEIEKGEDNKYNATIE